MRAQDINVSEEKRSEKSSCRHVLCSTVAMMQTRTRLQCLRMRGRSHSGRGRNERHRNASPYRGGPSCGELHQILCNKSSPYVWVSFNPLFTRMHFIFTNIPFSSWMAVRLSSWSKTCIFRNQRSSSAHRFLHEIGIQHFSCHFSVTADASHTLFHIILFFFTHVFHLSYHLE